MNILIIEDDKEISQILKTYLEKEMYKVEQVFDGKKAITKVTTNNYDLIILDLMLPVYSGEQILSIIRKTSSVPVIILSAKASEKSKLFGLLTGADDYITKPFSTKEVVARVNALLRRANEYNNNKNSNNTYDDGVLKINFDKMEVYINNKEINLTTNEFKILEVFVKNEGIVLSREQIIELAFNNLFDGSDRNIDTYIKNIRSKLSDKETEEKFIITIYSLGYKFIRKSDLYEDK